MTLLYSDRRFLQHETGDHPENAARIRGIPARLEEVGLIDACVTPKWEPISRKGLGRIHSPDYADEVRSMAKLGGGDIESDTVVSPDSYDVALEAAGAVCDATRRIIQGEDTQAFCLVRPPGHHALAHRAMGFCLFNNIALAATTATDELDVNRVLIVDWDVHHGNGTQASFWSSPQVGFLSIHRWPFFPGTGDHDETGSGDGLGTTVNLPVRHDVSREDFLAAFSAALEKMAVKMKPELILLSAGFDAHRGDPVGSL